MALLNKIITSALLVMLLIANQAIANDDLVIEEAWVREGPPSATVLAGYLTIKNKSSEAYTLTQVRSPQFETTEMHESFEEDGMMRMRKHNSLDVPSQGELSFTPSGFHLMLMDPFQPLREGAEVELILEFQNQAPLSVRAPVKRVID